MKLIIVKKDNREWLASLAEDEEEDNSEEL